MAPEQADRMKLGWSREDLARYSNVSLASIYLIERLGSATPDDDVRIRNALARGLAKQVSNSNTRSNDSLLVIDPIKYEKLSSSNNVRKT
jgi:transcriptional regulator with XRE-family HTH domain